MPPEGFRVITVSRRAYDLLTIRAKLARTSRNKIIEELLGIR